MLSYWRKGVFEWLSAWFAAAGKLLESVSFVIALCFFSMLALSFYLLSQYPPWGIAILCIVFTPLARVFDTYRDIRQGLIRLGD